MARPLPHMALDVRRRGGGLAAWSIGHPVGVVMIALAIIALGLTAVGRLAVDLLPDIIYPEISVRVIDPGVPATVMEDRITRQLEEQLAITEDAVGVQSRTTEGRSAVDLTFEYGTDIDRALRDASTRLDRARRFLPETIDPPIIFKRDPSQIPVLELVVSASLRNAVELRNWVDDVFAKWFLNLPGVAAAEVGGGLVREIQVLPDQQRLAALGLTMDSLVEALKKGNRDEPAGRFDLPLRELSGRTAGRFQSPQEIAELPLALSGGKTVPLKEVARVSDSHDDERLRIRWNGTPGIKVSIQKQPTANTVAVVDEVRARLAALQSQGMIPRGVEVREVSDQALYVRNSLSNAALAAVSGALLAMAVVYLFLGSLRRTLIIGSAIPLAIMVTVVLMGLGGLTLNIMTLGGLALGVGMLVDNTIVMLENIVRHQRLGEDPRAAAASAAAEVNSAVVASTTTNLAAVLPFLFVGGLVGLLFRELIFTISAAILASLVVAVTLVPALAGNLRDRGGGRLRLIVDRVMEVVSGAYARALGVLLKVPWLWPVLFGVGLWWAAPTFLTAKQEFLPTMDDGRVSVSLTADPGTRLDQMDQAVRAVERVMRAQPEVEGIFSTIGGFVFGRSQYESSNRSSLNVQLVPRERREVSTGEWVSRMEQQIQALRLPGVTVRMRTGQIRGIRLSQGDDDISVRLQGEDLDTLSELGDRVVQRLRRISGLRNVKHSAEEVRQELAAVVDRERAALLGVDVEQVGRALRIALEGEVVTDFIEGGRAYDLRVRLPQSSLSGLQDLRSVLVFRDNGPPVHLGEVAEVHRVPAPGEIMRDRQRRIVEVSASLGPELTVGEANRQIEQALSELTLPAGYTAYSGGSVETLERGRSAAVHLLGLALFLVLVVMAVQYESLRNPLVILASIPFAAIGVAAGLQWTALPLSMPVWLGMIMLAGIVVNNAIVLVEYVEILRERGTPLASALVEGAATRLRPILMTTLTTVVGMLPLALGYGEGSEMLRPLAVTVVWGLSFSTVVSLLLVPAVYRLAHRVGAHP